MLDLRRRECITLLSAAAVAWPRQSFCEPAAAPD